MRTSWSKLTDLVLTRDTRAATSFVASLQAGGSSVETLYLDLLAPSARRLGEMWTEDVCSFVDVTVALGRLQHVLHDLSPAFHTGARIFPRGRRVVLVPAPGDQHTFGLAMVVQFFRRAGWAVSGEVATATADLVSMVRHDWFALVGFSVSCDARLEALAAGIRLVRRASRNPAIGVMVGGPIFIDRPETRGARRRRRDGGRRPPGDRAGRRSGRLAGAPPVGAGQPEIVMVREGVRERRAADLVKAFKAPQRSLGNLDADAAATLIAAATDVSVIVDASGVVRDLAFHSEELSNELDGSGRWLNQPWIDTVTVESRPKVEALLREATARKAIPRWRHINHPSPSGTDVPILYSAVQVGEQGRIVAFGRDLRAISVLQQRLVDAQQSLERDYSRLRHVEARYRMLFELSSEAVLILDATTLKVTEANPAARLLFGDGPKRLLGRAFIDLFDAEGGAAVDAMLVGLRGAGRAENARARLVDGGLPVMVSASLFRQDNGTFLLARMFRDPADNAVPPEPQIKSKLLQLVESAPDGFVVTGTDGLILTANAAFLDMAEMASEEAVRGESLDRWVGRPGVDLSVLLANLRQRGSVRLFATIVHGEFGTTADAEISAVAITNGGQPCFGFAIRNIGRRLQPDTRAGRELPQSIAQLTELIGRVSLKDLVRETTDVIERLCIEAALELTGDNRASAAEMLGLSRQSLYVKLRRYGLGDLAPESGN